MTRMMSLSCRIAARNFAFGAMAVSMLSLGACESARDPQLLSNPNYSSGYSDGCQSSQSQVSGFDDTVTRNVVLAEIEPAYDMGWRDGFAACGDHEFDTNDGSTRDIFRRGSEHYESAPH